MTTTPDLIIDTQGEAYSIDSHIADHCDWGYELDDDGFFWEARLNSNAVVVDITKLRNAMNFDDSQLAMSFEVTNYTPNGPVNDITEKDCYPIECIRFAAYHMQVDPETGRTTVTYEVEIDE